MSTVLEALRKADERRPRGGGLGDEPPRRPPRRRGPRLLWVLLGLLALVGAFAGGLELSGGDDADEPPRALVSADVEERVQEPPPPAEVDAAPAPPQLEVAAAPESPPEIAPPAPEPVERQAPPAEPEAVQFARAQPAAVQPPPPSAARAPVMPEMSDRRREALERVLRRREERKARREERRASRSESQELRDAIRNARTPEEREALLGDFRERRKTARALRRAESAEKRVEREEARAHLEATGRRIPVAQSARAAAAPVPAVEVTQAATPPAAQPAAAPEPAAPAPAPAPVAIAAASPVALRRPPTDAPQVRINILQYSADPGRRFAYVSVEGDPAITQVREGESYQGLTITRIYPEQIEFAHQGTTFLLRAN